MDDSPSTPVSEPTRSGELVASAIARLIADQIDGELFMAKGLGVDASSVADVVRLSAGTLDLSVEVPVRVALSGEVHFGAVGARVTVAVSDPGGVLPRPPVVRQIDGILIGLFCPGCDTEHVVPVEGSTAWTWNGDMAAPTLSPSILVHPVTHGTPEEPIHRRRCHSFVRGGNWEFLSDCGHDLAGKTVPVPQPREITP